MGNLYSGAKCPNYFSMPRFSLCLFPSLIIIAFTTISLLIAQIPFLKNLAISPLIIGIFLGIFLGNTVRGKFPKNWDKTIVFFCKQILRLGIIFYGFRVSFQDVLEVGILGMGMAFLAVFSTFFLGYFLGRKVFGLDREVSALVSSGASVCGAAAVLATESTIRAKAENSALAVATVVVFGTVSMFLYPLLFQSGIFSLPPEKLGIFLGASVHEVAQVVASGNIFSAETAESALIVKMIRVILLVPFLIILGIFWMREASTLPAQDSGGFLKKAGQALPIFAVYFLGVIMLNSLISLPEQLRITAGWIDQIFLTAAMFALGLETHLAKFKNAGGKAFALAFVLFLWLGGMCYGVLRFL
jgi:uncharacterized integral membrane protein (TIGR00698 family)